MSRYGSLRPFAAALLLGLAACLALVASTLGSRSATAQSTPPDPILVLTSAAAPFSDYYPEILRTEGLNALATADIGALDANLLQGRDLVLLPKMTLSAAQVQVLTNWVNSGGRLVAVAPDPQLAALLGLVPTGNQLAEGYLRIDTGTAVGNGIVGESMQFHGVADRYTLGTATPIAMLYGNAVTPTANPAVTLRAAGSGQAAAFTYDLARSIVYTRQGNPDWAAQERDGLLPIRSDDKFYGAAVGDPQADWVDFTKVAIPQADEQQRLLANLILHMTRERKPLPRFWYFPNDKKAVVVMTGDDHGNGGTGPRFDLFKAQSPAGCSVANWECVRGTSYIYANTPLTNAQAVQYEQDGFEVGLHINTGCADYTLGSLRQIYTDQLADWQAKYSAVPAPRTQRHHCIVWSDWTTGAQVQLEKGIRFDTSYYYWPPSWVGNVPGLFTGSAMPMRFATQGGSPVDVFLAATQMTDESGQAYPYTVDTLLDRALGPQGYYGAYVVNAHTDAAESEVSAAVVPSALARGVPVVSSRQMLTWLDARNASAFTGLSWSGGALSFGIVRAPAALGLRAMLPLRSAGGVLGSLTRAGSPVNYVVRGIKGVEYAVFDADAGSYVASYAADGTAPAIVATTPAAGATGVPLDSVVAATFNDTMDPQSIGTATFELRAGTAPPVTASVGYDAATRTALLRPTGGLAGGTTYTATIRGGPTLPNVRDAAGNPVATTSWSFTTAAAPACPCNGLGAGAAPGTASANDPNPVEVGVKFRTTVDGAIAGIRFFKGGSNTGTHIGNLWTATGQLLASATFVNETGSGWQQVNFATPVQISANTVYVASYFAPNGGYAADLNYFAGGGVVNGPVVLLQDGPAGGNGVYGYGSQSSFPNDSYQAANYWVDVVFVGASAAPDTTPPTVTANFPTANAAGVSTGTGLSVTFSEAMSPASVNASSFVLRDGGGAVVPAAVAYDASTRTATLTPSSALVVPMTYTASALGGAADPRVKDAAGNALAATHQWSFSTAASGSVCASPANAVVAENCLPGNPASEWDITGIGDPDLQGFATQISVNKGSTVGFKLKTGASAYRLDVYRLGWYGGAGARKVATVQPSAVLPQVQPACLNDPATGLIDCGNWALSATWQVPSTAVSGIYVARAVRTDTGGASHIVFVVRDDARAAQLLFQTSDTTWQAYNDYGGNSLYTGGPGVSPGRAYKVSYNRPFNTRIVDNGQDWLFNAEYPMLRWLEANGYDVAYAAGADVDRDAARVLNRRVFLSVGHDEYWSAAQRANVEAARNAGVNLAFFSGNEIFWKTRWENSIDTSSTPYRTLVSYKETHANAKIDPSSAWTGTWRDKRFSPPSDGGRPENALTGTAFAVNAGTTAITVPEADGKMRFWRNTSVAALAAGQTATLPMGTLGYEWDIDADNGSRPPGLVRLSTTTHASADVLQDLGNTYATGVAVHRMTFYRHTSGARVFGAGTIQWTWGLDATHDRSGTPADVRMRQATVNLLADMNVQPASLQAGLTAATMSTDTVAPTATLAAPAAPVYAGVTRTLTGTATDVNGRVGGVEVSVDGGTTWRAANGRGSWTFDWSPPAAGTYQLRARAVDDSGNLGAPTPLVTVTVQPRVCPCTIWPATATPVTITEQDSAAVTLGLRFRSTQAGTITGIRFYKGPSNTGTHIGGLWSAGGQLLASATFTNESASGWQQVNFATPVAVAANTVYVATYFAPAGSYSVDAGYFAGTGVDSAPLRALADGESGANGLYAYGAAHAFPTGSYASSNYWIDVVFATPPPDTTPPTVTTITPASGATNVSRSTTVTAVFSEAMTATTITTGTVQLRTAAGALVTATVSYDATARRVTLTPSSRLAALTNYTVTILGGTTDPRVKDAAGNALATTRTWTFRTSLL